MLEMTSQEARALLPKEHILHLVHQMAISGANLGVYMCNSETGVLFSIMVYCKLGKLSALNECIVELRSTYADWAHSGSQIVPAFALQDDEAALLPHLTFFNSLNNYVCEKGRMRPVRVFRYRVEAMYSRSMGGWILPRNFVPD